jgi:hypothetical protein
LVDLGLVRRLAPWHANTGKRMVRSPKVYVRDTGLLHALLEVPSLHALAGHPVVGASYETLVVETLINAAGPRFAPYFYRTADGAEIDLLLVRAGAPHIAVEVKRSTSPVPSLGFHRAVADLGVVERYLVCPIEDSYLRSDGTTVMGLIEAAQRIAAVG